jgi:hypothetical protein
MIMLNTTNRYNWVYEKGGFSISTVDLEASVKGVIWLKMFN